VRCPARPTISAVSCRNPIQFQGQLYTFSIEKVDSIDFNEYRAAHQQVNAGVVVVHLTLVDQDVELSELEAVVR
jgi:hypothetical protein